MVNTRFSLTFPDLWKETTIHTFEGPNDSGVQHNLVVTVSEVEKGTRLVDFAKKMLEMSAAALPAFEMISETEMQLPTGGDLYVVVYRYTTSDDKKYFQKQYYTIEKTKVFTFTATFSKKTLKTVANEVDEIVASFVTSSEGEH